MAKDSNKRKRGSGTGQQKASGAASAGSSVSTRARTSRAVVTPQPPQGPPTTSRSSGTPPGPAAAPPALAAAAGSASSPAPAPSSAAPAPAPSKPLRPERGSRLKLKLCLHRCYDTPVPAGSKKQYKKPKPQMTQGDYMVAKLWEHPIAEDTDDDDDHIPTSEPDPPAKILDTHSPWNEVEAFIADMMAKKETPRSNALDSGWCFLRYSPLGAQGVKSTKNCTPVDADTWGDNLWRVGKLCQLGTPDPSDVGKSFCIEIDIAVIVKKAEDDDSQSLHSVQSIESRASSSFPGLPKGKDAPDVYMPEVVKIVLRPPVEYSEKAHGSVTSSKNSVATFDFDIFSYLDSDEVEPTRKDTDADAGGAEDAATSSNTNGGADDNSISSQTSSLVVDEDSVNEGVALSLNELKWTVFHKAYSLAERSYGENLKVLGKSSDLYHLDPSLNKADPIASGNDFMAHVRNVATDYSEKGTSSGKSQKKKKDARIIEEGGKRKVVIHIAASYKDKDDATFTSDFLSGEYDRVKARQVLGLSQDAEVTMPGKKPTKKELSTDTQDRSIIAGTVVDQVQDWESSNLQNGLLLEHRASLIDYLCLNQSKVPALGAVMDSGMVIRIIEDNSDYLKRCKGYLPKKGIYPTKSGKYVSVHDPDFVAPDGAPIAKPPKTARSAQEQYFEMQVQKEKRAADKEDNERRSVTIQRRSGSGGGELKGDMVGSATVFLKSSELDTRSVMDVLGDSCTTEPNGVWTDPDVGEELWAYCGKDGFEQRVGTSTMLNTKIRCLFDCYSGNTHNIVIVIRSAKKMASVGQYAAGLFQTS